MLLLLGLAGARAVQRSMVLTSGRIAVILDHPARLVMDGVAEVVVSRYRQG
jgi:hypothetical protein